MKTFIFAMVLAALATCQSAHAFKVGGMNWVTADGTANQCMKTDGAGSLAFRNVIDASYLSGTAPVSYVSGTGVISMHVADGTHDGFLASADWTAFMAAYAASVTNATASNTASTIVKRDGSGSFAATTITAALSGNATTATTATNATNGTTVAASVNASYFPAFFASSSNGNQPFNLGTGLTFNPSTNTLSTTTFSGALSGNATTATTATNQSGGTVAATTGSFSGALTSTANGAASTPAEKLSGTWFTGGSATTTKPQLLIEPSGATTTNWSTNGTGLGVNAASGFTGNLIAAQTNGTNEFLVTAAGAVTATGAMAASNLSGTNTGDVTLVAFDASPNANGATLSGQALTLQPADATNPGGVSTTTQTFAGAKTFSGSVTSNGVLSVTDTTDATGLTTASLKTSGGLSVTKKGHFNGATSFTTALSTGVPTGTTTPIFQAEITGVSNGFNITGNASNQLDYVFNSGANASKFEISDITSQVTSNYNIALNSIRELLQVGGTTYGQIGAAISSGDIITGSSTNDIDIRTNSTNFRVSTDNGATSALTISSAGATGLGTAPAAQKLKVQGTANDYATYLLANSTSGQSYGLLINGGTTSADYALNVKNQAGSSDYLTVRGDGVVVTKNNTLDNAGAATFAHKMTASQIYVTGNEDGPTATTGSIYYSSGNGLSLVAASASSTNDFALIQGGGGGATIVTVPHGTQNVVLTGNLSVTGVSGLGGGGTLASSILTVDGTASQGGGVSQNGINIKGTYDSTTNTRAILASPTIKTGVTSANVRTVDIEDTTLQSSALVTNQVGLYIADQTVGSSLAAGLQSTVTSGTGKWNVYSTGTADNALRGNVRVGSTVAPTVALDVTGAALVSTTLGVTGTTTAAAINASGVVSVTDTTDATGLTTASLKTSGGLAVTKKGHFNGATSFTTALSSGVATGVSGGIFQAEITGVSGGFNIQNNASNQLDYVFNSGANSTKFEISDITSQVTSQYNVALNSDRLLLQVGGVTQGQVGAATTSGDIITGSSTNDFNVRTNSSNFRVSTDNGATSALAISAAGATSLSGSLGVTGNFSVNTNKFAVTASTGNTGIGVAAQTPTRLTVEDTTDNTTIGTGEIIRLDGGTGLATDVVELGFSYGGGGGANTFPSAVMGYKLTSGSGASKGSLYFGTRNVVTDTAPVEQMTIDPTGAISMASTLTVTGATTVTGGIVGTTTNNNATAGNVGEALRAAVAQGSAVTLTTTTAANVTSVAYTAGDWDVDGVVCFNGTVTGTLYQVSVNTTSATQGTLGDNQIETLTSPTAAADNCITIPGYRVSSAGSGTFYLVATGTFTVGTLKAYGRLSARRIR